VTLCAFLGADLWQSVWSTARRGLRLMTDNELFISDKNKKRRMGGETGLFFTFVR
jgi:hypothetical protein